MAYFDRQSLQDINGHGLVKETVLVDPCFDTSLTDKQTMPYWTLKVL